MTRSERLAKEGKIDIGMLGIAKVIKNCNVIPNLRYIGTDFDCLYDGKEVNVDIYESRDSMNPEEIYAVIC